MLWFKIIEVTPPYWLIFEIFIIPFFIFTYLGVKAKERQVNAVLAKSEQEIVINPHDKPKL